MTSNIDVDAFAYIVCANISLGDHFLFFCSSFLFRPVRWEKGNNNRRQDAHHDDDDRPVLYPEAGLPLFTLFVACCLSLFSLSPLVCQTSILKIHFRFSTPRSSSHVLAIDRRDAPYPPAWGIFCFHRLFLFAAIFRSNRIVGREMWIENG